jgi:murein DD-endopeptidase MepM/ murein hydrolase activator NlpD
MPISFARIAAALLLTSILGACELDQASGDPAKPVVQAPPVETVTVAQGDTLYSISRRLNVSVRAMIDTNHLSPPYRLIPGQRLMLPGIVEHVVKPGETLLAVAQRYGTTPADLARINNLKAPNYVIKVGQRLTLPAAAKTASAAPEQLANKADRRPATVETQPLPPPSQPQPQPQQAPHQQAPAAQPQASPPMEPLPVSARVERPVNKHNYAPLTEPPALSGGFAWPARGRLVARFGVMGKGVRNDGINIEVPRGAPVRAAADGVVAYAGNELRGFGNLLLIKHADGWMSAYGHNDELVVKRGEVVKRGQVVAKAGASGNVRTPQLHFELRKNGDAVDPQRHLPDYRVDVPASRSAG